MRSDLQLRGKAEAKELPTPFKSPSPYDAFLRRGNLLPSRNERSEVKSGDMALLTQSVASLKFNIFAVRVSETQIYKFEFKFE